MDLAKVREIRIGLLPRGWPGPAIMADQEYSQAQKGSETEIPAGIIQGNVPLFDHCCFEIRRRRLAGSPGALTAKVQQD